MADEREELQKLLNPQLPFDSMLTHLGVSVHRYQYENPPPYVRGKFSEHGDLQQTADIDDSPEHELLQIPLDLPKGVNPKYQQLLRPHPSKLRQIWAFFKKLHRPEVLSNHRRVEWICVSLLQGSQASLSNRNRNVEMSSTPTLTIQILKPSMRWNDY